MEKAGHKQWEKVINTKKKKVECLSKIILFSEISE